MCANFKKEGEIVNNIFYERCIRRNKNMIILVTGPTGSGKTYTCVRVGELWYKRHFHKKFPVENICFSLDELMERLAKGNLGTGDMLILEEAGTSMGNLDFQNKASKMFNYILQTFRNRNIILMMNLPYFTMLNKTTRMLAHMRWEMLAIDKTKKIAFIKAYWIQVSQEKGKVYFHFPKIMVDGSMERVNYLTYHLPSPPMVDEYEKKKTAFVMGLTNNVMMHLNEQKKKENARLQPKELSEKQKKVYDFVMEHPNQYNLSQTAEKLGIPATEVSQIVKKIEFKGFLLRNYLTRSK